MDMYTSCSLHYETLCNKYLFPSDNLHRISGCSYGKRWCVVTLIVQYVNNDRTTMLQC